MISVDDKNIIKEIRLILDEINQDLKNINDVYMVRKGIFYAYGNGISKCKTKIVLPDRLTKKYPDLEDIFSNLNGCIDGSKLYDFIKKYKNNISSIEFYKNNFIIQTNLPEVNFVSNNLTDYGNIFKSYKHYKNKKEDICYEQEFSYNDFKSLKDKSGSHLFNFDDKYKVILVSNLFLGFKANTKCNIKIYNTNDSDNDIYYFVINIVNSKHSNELLYPFVNF